MNWQTPVGWVMMFFFWGWMFNAIPAYMKGEDPRIPKEVDFPVWMYNVTSLIVGLVGLILLLMGDGII